MQDRSFYRRGRITGLSTLIMLIMFVGAGIRSYPMAAQQVAPDGMPAIDVARQVSLREPVLPHGGAQSHSVPAAAGDERWDDRFGLPGVTYGQVYATAVIGTDIYVAGSFSNAAGLPSSSIMRWNGRHWVALGEGVKTIYGYAGTVYALAVNGNDLYVGGDFATAGGNVARNIARWNGKAWAPVGNTEGPRDTYNSPMPIKALAWNNGRLYAGGTFSKVDGVAAANIASWNGAAWSPVGAGIGNYSVYEQAFTGGAVNVITASGGGIYAGGSFNRAGTVDTYNIAYWNGTAWTAFDRGVGTLSYDGTAISGGQVNAITVGGGKVYAGGEFTVAGKTPANRVAVWNLTAKTWTALGIGMNPGSYSGPVNALALVGTDLYAGGSFASAGTTAARNLARWNGTSWATVGSGASNGVDYPVNVLMPLGRDLLAGGDFDYAGTMLVNQIGRWDGTTWHGFGEGIAYNSISGRVEAVAVDGRGRVYITGFFTYAAGLPVSNIAMWDGTRWWDMGGGIDSSGYALAAIGDTVYVGGGFTRAGGISANRIASWNAVTQKWSALSSGINGSVYGLAVHGTDVFAGGDFSAAGGISTENIARWDGTRWNTLGTGLDFNGRVNAVAVDEGGTVVVGGDFSSIALPDNTAVRITANAVALWNSADSGWYLLGVDGQRGVTRHGTYSDFSGTVYAAAIVGGDVFVGGRFDKAGNVAAANIARWNAASNVWHALGASIGGTTGTPEVHALTLIGNDLFVGGSFSVAGTATDVGNIARWNIMTSQWSALGSGVSGDGYGNSVKALAAYGDGLSVGGEFLQAGGKPSSAFAWWGAPAWTATITPATGGRLTAQQFSITFPAGAVASPTTARFTDLFAATKPMPKGSKAVRAFELTAQAAGGQPVRTFTANYTMRVNYTDAQLKSLQVSEAALRLVYFNGTAWVEMPGIVDSVNNVVEVQANHFTEFALIGSAGAPPPTPTTVPPTRTTVPPTPTTTVPTPTKPTSTVPKPTATRTPTPGDQRYVFLPLVNR